jgi:DNA-binding transcriptional regulator YhcF (GntR family)
MAPHSIEDFDQSRLGQMAGILERDIGRKGLRPGDPYLTATEASQMLGVSRMTANRALNLLARRQLLTRHRSRGTFVGPDAPRALAIDPAQQDVKYVHYLTFVDDNPAHQLPVGKMLTGFQAAIEGVMLRTHVLPLNMTPQQFRSELEAIIGAGQTAGVVVTLGTREIQQIASECKAPVVIHGSAHPGIDLPSLEVDQEQTGRLMAEHAISMGYQRLVFVAREFWRRGDSLALDGIQAAAAAAGISNSGVMVRNVSTDAKALRVGVEEILRDVPRPAAFICRLPYFAGAIVDVAKGRGLKVFKDFGVVYDHTSEEGRPPLPYPCARSEVSVQDQMTLIAQMLTTVAAGGRPDPFRALVPAHVEIEFPTP